MNGWVDLWVDVWFIRRVGVRMNGWVGELGVGMSGCGESVSKSVRMGGWVSRILGGKLFG